MIQSYQDQVIEGENPQLWLQIGRVVLLTSNFYPHAKLNQIGTSSRSLLNGKSLFIWYHGSISCKIDYFYIRRVVVVIILV